MRPLHIFAALPLVLAACGGKFTGIDNGSSSSGGSSGASSSSGGSSSGGSSGASSSGGGGGFTGGSFDLTFTTVTQAQNGGLFGTPPSQGHSFRVDIVDTKGSWSALVTPRWGDAAVYSAQIDTATVALTGKGAYRDGSSSDTWTTITLFRDTAGGVRGGSFSAAGTEQQSNGDVVGQGAITATGSYTLDQLAPEAKIGATSLRGPDTGLLPWDPISIRLAEPVTGPSDLFGGVALDSAAGGALALAWEPPQGVPAPFAGTLAGTAHRTSFAPAGTTQVGWPATGIADSVGHVLAPIKQPIAFLDLAILSASHTFDGDVVTVGTWGATQMLGGKAGADPTCESGGCAQIGQFSDGYCNVPRIGLAARLDTTGAKSIDVRYRVLAATPDPNSSYPPSMPAAFTLEIAQPGAPIEFGNVWAGSRASSTLVGRNRNGCAGGRSIA